MFTAKVKFLERLDGRLLCPLCHDVFNKPWQTSCGHQFCFDCLQSLFRNTSPRCPVDGESIARNSSFHDKCCEREVLDLQCVCRYEARKCDWQGELRQLQVHEDHCEYADVLCRACENVMERRFLEDHRVNNCINRAVKCIYCGGEVRRGNLKDHLEVCLKFPIDCILSCGKEAIARELMEDHVTTECPNAEVVCLFTPHGCEFKGKRDALQRHMTDSIKCHLDMLNQSSHEYQVRNKEMDDKLTRLQSEVNSLEQQICSHNGELVAAKVSLQTQQNKISVVEREISEQRKDMDKLLRDVKAAGNVNEGVVSLQMDEILKTLREHEIKMTQLQDELRRLTGRTLTGYEPPRVNNGSNPTCERRLDRAEHQLALHEIQLSEQNLQIEMLEATSYNGVYTWKIDQYSRRFQEAVSGRTPSIYSPPFYVGRFGYKVCTRLYPNGDGVGKGTHMSIFFIVMMGEYDAILPWPFVQKVHFRLLDQDGIRDMVDVFRHESNSASAKRPTSDMNTASGCPRFISQAEVREGGYVRGDTMFIKVTVDMANLQGELWR